MKIEFRPLSDALGAEVIGVNVAGDLSEQTISEIRAGWLQHNILLFRNQEMTMEQQKNAVEIEAIRMKAGVSAQVAREQSNAKVAARMREEGDILRETTYDSD